MSRCWTEVSHLYRPDRRAIKRIPSKNTVATTAVGNIASNVVAYILVLIFVALVTLLAMSLPFPQKWPADWRVFWSMCKVSPPVILVRCLIEHLLLWHATKEAIADTEFLDQIFEELYEDAESLLEKKLPLGDERWNHTANLANDYADASHMLIKFLVRERKQIAKEKMEGDAEKGGVRRGDLYILVMKDVLELRKQIMLEGVKLLANLPAGAGRMDSMAASCKEFGRIVNDTQQARCQAWWTAEKPVKDMEKANEMERLLLLEQSIMECTEGVLLHEMA